MKGNNLIAPRQALRDNLSDRRLDLVFEQAHVRNAELELQHLDQLLLCHIALRDQQIPQLLLRPALLPQRLLQLIRRNDAAVDQQVSQSLFHRAHMRTPPSR